MFNIIALIIFVTSLLGCGSSKGSGSKYPINVTGIKTSISKIQISPIAYDRAIVAIQGNVVDIIEEDYSEENNILFTLSDPEGFKIDVNYTGSSTISKGEIVIISGKYIKNENTIYSDYIYKVLQHEEKKLMRDVDI